MRNALFEGGIEAWYFVRATGFAAFAALGLDMVVGLMISTRLSDRWLARGTAVELHRWLSPISLALVLAHAAVLLADDYVRFDVLDLLIPFITPYRPFATGLGVVALYVAVVVHASFALRKRIGARVWRRLHYLSFVAFAGAAVHACAAGTDTAHTWAIVLIAVPVTAVALLVGARGAR